MLYFQCSGVCNKKQLTLPNTILLKTFMHLYLFLYFILLFFRLLEIYILNGPTPDAIDKLIKQLDDPKRICPNELDKAMVSQIRHVLQVKDQPHVDVTCNIFKNSWGKSFSSFWDLFIWDTCKQKLCFSDSSNNFHWLFTASKLQISN